MASNAIESQGVNLEWDGTDIGEVLSFSGPGGSAAIIDKTNLASTAREKMMGLPDEGQISFDLSLYPPDAGQAKLIADRQSRTRKTCRLFLTDTGGTILTCDAYCTGFSIAGSVDDKVTASVSIEIDGNVNWSPLLNVETAYNTDTGVIVLGLSGDTFAAASETTGNWEIGFDSSGLTLTSVTKDTDTQCTLNLNTSSEVAGDYTLTFQAEAAALTGDYPSGVLSTDITILEST